MKVILSLTFHEKSEIKKLVITFLSYHHQLCFRKLEEIFIFKDIERVLITIKFPKCAKNLNNEQFNAYFPCVYV